MLAVLNDWYLQKHSFLPACTPPPGYASHGGKHYRLYGTMSFPEAMAACNGDGAWVAMPKTTTDYAAVKSELKKKKMVAKECNDN